MKLNRSQTYPLWTSAEAAAVTGGGSALPWTASGVSIDSRSVESGDLFVALPGPNYDGHSFVNAAFERAAAAAMVREPSHETVDDKPLLIVVDTFEGLQNLALHARERSAACVVAVTGSVGKTGTKELLSAALGSGGPTSVSMGNLNNHIGVPLSLARLPRDVKYGVFELGMNHPGEISALSSMVRPHIALITTVAAVHTEMFASLDAVADAKTEIFTGLEPGGSVVLNRDNQYFERMLEAAAVADVGRVISFGESDTAEARLLAWQPKKIGGCVEAIIGGQKVGYDITLSGKQWALNSVAALAVAEAAGVPVELAANALRSVVPVKGRGTRHWVTLGDGECELIDESYNASPVAMRAAIATLGTVNPSRGAGRRIAVLGDMLELGDMSGQLHSDLAREILSAGVDIVFTAGTLMQHLFEALDADRRGVHASTSKDLVEPLLAEIRPGDVILIKGSLGIRMGDIVERLLQDERPASSVARLL